MEIHHKNRYFIWFFIAAAVAAAMTIDVRLHEIPLLDQWTSAFAVSLDGTFWFLLFRWITELGSSTFLTFITCAAAILFWLRYKNLLASGMILAGAAIGYQLNFAIKGLVERPRPRELLLVDGSGFSFPSGHAMASMIVYALIVYFLSHYLIYKNKQIRIGIAAGLLILLIGISRYVLRVHYLTDIIAGYAYGMMFVIVWILLYKWLEHQFYRKGGERARS